MADWLTIISALVVVFGFITLTLFIQRLGLLEANAMIRPVMQPIRGIPSQRVVGVRNPFELKLVKDVIENQGMISLLLSCSRPCYVTLYWGLKKIALQNEIKKREENRDVSDNQQNEEDYDDEDLFDEDDLDDNVQISGPPIERILENSYLRKGTSLFFNPGSNHELLENVPDQLDSFHLDESLHTLVVGIEQLRDEARSRESVRSHDIVTLITAYRSTASQNNLKLHPVVQYIQTADGRLFPLQKLFVNANEEAEQRSSRSSTESYGTCIVCQSFPVSRALLPCRHACVCGDCFAQLQSKCPLCRQPIQSYFLTQREPNLGGTELDTSRQLNRMSFMDLVRGVLSAS